MTGWINDREFAITRPNKTLALLPNPLRDLYIES